MRLRATILLLAANIVTFLLIWKIEGGREYQPAINAPLFPTDIRAISVEGPSAFPYTLERQQRGWRVTAPFQWEASPAADYIMEQLRFLRSDGGFTVEEAKANGSKLSDYGLDNPAARVTVRGENSEKPITIAIGITSPDARISLLTPSGRILPSNRKFYETLIVQPDTLRSNTVFDIEAFQVRSVAVRFPSNTDAPERQFRIKSDTLPIPNSPETERIWRFETPFNGEANLALTDAAIARLTTLNILRFPPRPNTPPNATTAAATRDPFGLETPSLRISLEGTDRVRTLLIGARDPQSAPRSPARYAKLDDNAAVFTIPEASVADWREANSRLREREFFRFHPSQIEEIALLEQNGAKLILQRRTLSANVPAAAEKSPKSENRGPETDALFADWNIPAIPGTKATTTLPADPDAMRKLISELRQLAALPLLSGETPRGKERLCEAFPFDFPTPAELAALGFSKPDRRVELRFQDGSRKTLLLAAPVAKGTPWHACVEGSSSVYSIDGLLPEALSTDPNTYRNRAVTRLSKGSFVSNLKITDLRDNATLFALALPQPETSPAAALSKLPENERPHAAALFAQLGELRAKAFLPTAFTPKLRHKHPYSQTPATWRYRVDFVIRNPDANTEENRALYLTERLGGTLQIAGEPTSNTLFELDQTLLDALFPLTHLKTTHKDIPNISPPADLPPPPKAPKPQ